MMHEQAYGIFDSVDNAEQAVAALKDHGAEGMEISVVRRSDGVGLPAIENDASAEITPTSAGDVIEGAKKGGAIGLGLGLLAGAVALTVPGVGLILAAGPLAAAFGISLAGVGAGILGGGTVGYLIDQGVPEEAAARYHEALTRGDILVSVRSEKIKTPEALLLLQKYGATETATHVVGAPVLVDEPPVVDTTSEVRSPSL